MGLEAGDIGGNQFFHGGGGCRVIRTDKKGLPHVGDVKQARIASGPVMFSEDAGGILHGHFIAGKGHKLGAKCGMLAVKDCALKGSFVHWNSRQLTTGPTRICAWPAPSVREPESFRPNRHSDTARLAPTVRGEIPLLSRVPKRGGPFA